MRTNWFKLFALLVVLAMIISPLGTQPSLAETTTITATPTDNLPASETGLYIVQLTDASLASYEGGIAGLAATSPRASGARKLDASSPASQAYLSYLEGKQSEFITRMEGVLGRSVEVAFQYLGALNALAVQVEHAEALQLMSLAGVTAVYPDTIREMDTDVGPIHIGAPAIWEGETGNGMATRGEGIVIGMIDSGINSEHPSFAATDGDGYTHTNPYGAGVYTGWCIANPDFCNDKLIGAYSFNPVGASPEDTDGHGSHTGSTAGGNAHDAIFNVGSTEYTIRIQGVAPRANIVAYKVCNPSCPGTASIAAVNSAITTDMVDVLNYSISGGDSPWTDAVDLAFLDAFNAGIFVSAAAGNAGPGASTVAKTGPWNASVGASTHNRVIAHTVDVTGPTTPPELQDMAAVPGENTMITSDITGEVRFNAANPRGCTAHPANFFLGAIALIERGDCTFAVKVDNAVAAGAINVIVYNHVGGPPITMGALTGTPETVFIDNVNGADLRDFVIDNPGATVIINEATSLLFNDAWEDVMAGFSSRGPSQFELVKPDYVGPGVNILAAIESQGGDPVQYGFNQGTSMSSPHGAGAAALMMALYPSWSPAEIKSAIASGAVPDVLVKEDGVTPATPFDQGSGLMNLAWASNVGLVFDETGANYAAANPAIGGDPKTLNQPSMADYQCAGECTWTRTVKSVLDAPATYNASATAPVGMSVTITPSSFTIDPGEELELTITADVTGLPVGAYAFAQVNLETGTSSFTSTPNVAIPDNAYDGSMGSMACDAIDASSIPAGEAVTDVTVELAASHTWIGDLVVKLFSPDGGILGLLSRPGYAEPADDGTGCCGDSSNLSIAFPLLYTDASSDDAETMGDTIDTSQNVCEADGRCDYFPNPDSVVGHSSFAGFAGETAAGDWTLCMGDSVGGDTGTFAEWTLTIDYGDAPVVGIASQQLPVVVIPREVLEEPVITVDPASLMSSQGTNQVVTETLTVGNAGGADLLWEVVEDAPLATGTVLGAATPIQTSGTTVTIGDLNLAFSAGAEAGLTVIPSFPASPFDLVTITHSVSQAIVAGNSVACSSDGGVTTTENQFLRTFTLEDFGILGEFDVTEVQFGIENLSGSAQTLAINLYTLDGAFIYANMTLIGTADVALDPQSLTIATVLVTGTVPAGSTLVVEIAAPNMTGVSGFWIGSNTAGETAPSYIASTPCGLPNPLAFGAIGFPNVHVVMNVTGDAAPVSCDAPGGVSWVDVDPLAGTVIPGGMQDVSVTFDSTGLAMGEYTANLCLGSNDPVTPLVVVPLTLEVLEIPVIQVDPASLAFTVPVDNQADEMLTIGNVGISDLVWDIFEDNSPAAPLTDWMDDFDSYATGSQLHGQGGWKGWFNDPSAGALTSDAQANSAPNSAAILGATDLVREYSGYTSGTWTYTAWQYIPTDFVGQSYFIMLNSYDDAGTNLNWSVQVMLNGTANVVSNDGASGGTLPLIRGQWVELRLEIDLDADTQAFYYDNQLLYAGTWTNEVSGGGTLNIGAVDLYANGASVVYYDDMSLVAPIASCDAPEDIPWLSVAPTSGTTAPGASDDVTVSADATGLTVGETYTAVLCVTSNDPATPLVVVPVSMEVVEVEYGVMLAPAADAQTGAPGDTVEYSLTLTNTGNATDTFDVSFAGNTWDVHLPETEFMLGAGESAVVVVHVTIPMNAEDGDMDAVTVTATSQGDMDTSASSVLTTTAEVPAPEGYILYLPIVNKAFTP
jgi:subtilisin family serine protease/subtilisin-like proprotein convertase family protein